MGRNFLFRVTGKCNSESWNFTLLEQRVYHTEYLYVFSKKVVKRILLEKTHVWNVIYARAFVIYIIGDINTRTKPANESRVHFLN